MVVVVAVNRGSKDRRSVAHLASHLVVFGLWLCGPLKHQIPQTQSSSRPWVVRDVSDLLTFTHHGENITTTSDYLILTLLLLLAVNYTRPSSWKSRPQPPNPPRLLPKRWMRSVSVKSVLAGKSKKILNYFLNHYFNEKYMFKEKYTLFLTICNLFHSLDSLEFI